MNIEPHRPVGLQNFPGGTRSTAYRLKRAGAILLVTALAGGAGRVYYVTRSELANTRADLAVEQRQSLVLMSALQKTVANLVQRTHQRDDLQVSLNKATADLAALNQTLNGTKLQALSATIFANTMNQCLSGVEQALNAISVGDNSSAVRALQSVAGSCQQAQTYTGVEAADTGGPSYPFDFADPDVVRVGSTYYGYATNSAGGNIQMIESTSLTSWTPLGDALASLPAWSTRGATWAPAVARLGTGYVLYYATTVAFNGQDCISVATSASPAGPFVDSSRQPLVCQPDQGGSIDPDPVVTQSGAAFLIWKSNGGSGSPPEIWSQPLSGDGLAVAGQPVAILSPSQPWENGIIEGPAMIDDGGSYYLFYSANQWDSPAYSMGLAICSTPQGPCTKESGPVMGSADGTVEGPGGPAPFSDPNGGLFLAFHGFLPGQVGYPHPRYLFIRKMTISGSSVAFSNL